MCRLHVTECNILASVLSMIFAAKGVASACAYMQTGVMQKQLVLLDQGTREQMQQASIFAERLLAQQL